MIKLIASDVDGTLLPKQNMTLSPVILETMQEVVESGRHFCVATGRPYHDCLRMFAKAPASTLFACYDGALIMQNRKVLAKTPVDMEYGAAFARQVAEQTPYCVVFGGQYISYIFGASPAVLAHLRHQAGNHLLPVEDPAEIREAVYKISVYGTTPKTRLEFDTEKLKRVYNRKQWMEFVAPGTDKGAALCRLQAALSVTPEETMVFGDGENDIAMLAYTAHAYAMADGDSAFAEGCGHTTKSVVKTIRDVFFKRKYRWLGR